MSALRIARFQLQRLTQKRSLHMTGPATYSSTTLTTPEPAVRLPSSTTPPPKPSDRHINTSRVLKANNDTSTIDFAFLPSYAAEASSSSSADLLRVPVIPATETTPHAMRFTDHPEPAVMKPTIVAASPDSVVSAMADVHDNTAVHIDFLKVADSLGSVAVKVAEEEERVLPQVSTIGSLWAGLVEDVMGAKKKTAA
ncbi:hypothetical protein ANO11243_008940 [Dothideomycetidae sp. 11243]|nr:hypothetical protein ANO11243_008940 [fungal sp. No.11243]